MNKQQKQYALIAGAAIVLYLVYRWYSANNSGSTAATGVAAPDTSGTDYAALSGQEQSDVAGLQGQEQSDVSALQGQEQSDVTGLSGDISSLTGIIGTLSDTVTSIGTNQTTDEQTIAGLATGETQLNRAVLAQISTKPGGQFYKYYVNVTGHAPPANVRVSNFVYQAWKSGVKATAIAAKPHPSAPRNTQVAHPNANHTQQTHKPSTPPKASHPVQTHKPAPKPPPKTKPKKSGVRR